MSRPIDSTTYGPRVRPLRSASSYGTTTQARSVSGLAYTFWPLRPSSCGWFRLSMSKQNARGATPSTKLRTSS